MGAMLSGPSAFEGLEDLTAVRTWFIVRDMGVVSRLCNCLIVLRFLLSEVKLVGLVKCLLKELACYIHFTFSYVKIFVIKSLFN